MAWAVISFFITLALVIIPIRRLALPVVPTDTTSYSFGNFCFNVFKSVFTAFIGSALVQMYSLVIILFSSSIITAFVEIEPMSIPK